VIGESLRIACNGSELLSPLTGIGQYSKSLAEDLVARAGSTESVLRRNLEQGHPDRADQGDRCDKGIHQESRPASVRREPRNSAVAIQYGC
jgi:hypothetical protein